MMSRLDVAIRLLDDWYATLPLFKDGLPSRGTITGALVVLVLPNSEQRGF